MNAIVFPQSWTVPSSLYSYIFPRAVWDRGGGKDWHEFNTDEWWLLSRGAMYETTFVLPKDDNYKNENVLKMRDYATGLTNLQHWTLRFETKQDIPEHLMKPGKVGDILCNIQFVPWATIGEEEPAAKHVEKIIKRGAELGSVSHWGKTGNRCSLYHTRQSESYATWESMRQNYDPNCVFCNHWKDEWLDNAVAPSSAQSCSMTPVSTAGWAINYPTELTTF